MLLKQTNRELTCDTVLLTEIQGLFKFQTKCMYVRYTLAERELQDKLKFYATYL